MTEPTIKTATAADEEAVIAVVVMAFSADPAARWAYGDPQTVDASVGSDLFPVLRKAR